MEQASGSLTQPSSSGSMPKSNCPRLARKTSLQF